MKSKHIPIYTPTDNLTDREREQNDGFKHLLPRLREGSISFEVFSKRNRDTLDTVHLKGGGKDSDNARQRGRSEGEARHDPSLREEEGEAGFLRDSEQEGTREVSGRKGAERVQKEKTQGRSSEEAVKNARSRKKGGSK